MESLMVVLDPEVDALLSQMGADLDLSRESVAKIVLESALVMSLDR